MVDGHQLVSAESREHCEVSFQHLRFVQDGWLAVALLLSRLVPCQRHWWTVLLLDQDFVRGLKCVGAGIHIGCSWLIAGLKKCKFAMRVLPPRKHQVEWTVVQITTLSWAACLMFGIHLHVPNAIWQPCGWCPVGFRRNQWLSSPPLPCQVGNDKTSARIGGALRDKTQLSMNIYMFPWWMISKWW